jgi:hypothetical protein
MKLYVCYGTFKFAPRPGGHPCGNAYHALTGAGYRPEVVKAYGWGILPDAFNQTKGRKEVEQLTGNHWVPTLVTDDGTVVQGSHEIMDWAKANPAGSAPASAGASAPAAAAAPPTAPSAGPTAPADVDAPPTAPPSPGPGAAPPTPAPDPPAPSPPAPGGPGAGTAEPNPPGPGA